MWVWCSDSSGAIYEVDWFCKQKIENWNNQCKKREYIYQLKYQLLIYWHKYWSCARWVDIHTNKILIFIRKSKKHLKRNCQNKYYDFLVKIKDHIMQNIPKVLFLNPKQTHFQLLSCEFWPWNGLAADFNANNSCPHLSLQWQHGNLA